MKLAASLSALLLCAAPLQAAPQQTKPPRMMTKEEDHKLQLYMIKQCEKTPTASVEQVYCMQDVLFRVMKQWNAGKVPAFLK